MEYKTVFNLNMTLHAQIFKQKKKNMLMYIISLLTRPYRVTCGSEGACVCVCVCERERERERERLFLLSRRKEGSKCLIVNIAFYFHLYYLFTVQH